ncbi:family 88 glycosyl hydrolase [Ephemerocybe angulata]|uniref:Family 88 glycosyl hydrolase n=1 Tax=Ephemerocybe angulata TaxID=980116 RepID=A0A8H6I2S5_9AGAR|nr:family 88 glycosyl hydrolase [Tulosesus angulatus]
MLIFLPVVLLAVQGVRAATDGCDGALPYPFSPEFNIAKVTTLAESLPSHSWEYGTMAEALLELYNPDYAVFGSKAFPVPTLQKKDVRALEYAAKKITFGTGSDGLVNGNGAVGDPASLGVSAVLLGKTEKKYMDAAKQTAGYLVGSTRRQWNGAISHRRDVTELWSDFLYMAPPFLAYYAVHTKNGTLLQESVSQCRWYRQILRANTTAAYKGSWHHIIGPQSADWGLWSTGNAWAAAGMVRVLATILNSPFAGTLNWRDAAATDLNWYIREIIEGAMGSPMTGGLVRNYINDVSGAGGFGEVAGSALLAATTYRMMVLRPKTFADAKYAKFADGIRKTLGALDASGKPHVTTSGVVTPAVNPLNWKDTKPVTTGSPEAQAFVVLMYAAWRDCVLENICKRV